jgi:hypothetical protein
VVAEVADLHAATSAIAVIPGRFDLIPLPAANAATPQYRPAD